MLPNYFSEIPGYVSYFDKQYPKLEDCIEIDKQNLLIQKDIDAINQRIASNKREGIDLMKIGFGAIIRQKSLEHLNGLLNSNQNKQTLLDCRNKIETTRQDETAQIFTETSASAENRILKQTKTKQYVLAGIGAAVILTALTIFLMKRKK